MYDIFTILGHAKRLIGVWSLYTLNPFQLTPRISSTFSESYKLRYIPVNILGSMVQKSMLDFHHSTMHEDYHHGAVPKKNRLHQC